jgi:O-antigen ligase
MPAERMGDRLGWFAGGSAALLHLAGALKSIPQIGQLPIDFTVFMALLALPLLMLCAMSRRWVVAPQIGLALAAMGGLWLWLVLAGCWSASDSVMGAKLREIILLAPIMLMAGLVVAGDDAALRGFCAGVLSGGAVVAFSLTTHLAEGRVVLGGLAGADPEKWRIAYQVTGLAIAMAAALAAVHWAEAPGAARRLFWLAASLALALGAMLPGGRTALAALGACLVLVPLMILKRQQMPGRAALWAFGLCCLAGGAVWFAAGAAGPPARALERYLIPDLLEASGRLSLWGSALGLAGQVMPFGLGIGGFSLAAGFGEWRGRHPHNLALEALAEAGLPGLALWFLALGGAGWCVWKLGRTAPSWRLARILVLCLPMAMTLQVSTDLGNRMAWLTLGLALGLGLRAQPAVMGAGHVRALG